MRKYFVIVLLITIFISCNRNDKFVVEGEVLDAKGKHFIWNKMAYSKWSYSTR